MNRKQRKAAKRQASPGFETILSARMGEHGLREPGSFARALASQIAARHASPASAAQNSLPSPELPALPTAFPWRRTALAALATARRAWVLASPWVRRFAPGAAGQRKLRVVETVSLGDKRFAAVLDVDGKRFLIGGGAGTVSLLTALDSAPELPGSSTPPAAPPRNAEALSPRALHLASELSFAPESRGAIAS
jgi:flagellar biogenesis protein FliO